MNARLPVGSRWISSLKRAPSANSSAEAEKVIGGGCPAADGAHLSLYLISLRSTGNKIVAGRCCHGLHRNRFGKQHFPDLLGKYIWRQHAHRHAEQLQQLMTDSSDVEQDCLRGRIDQYVEVALFGIVAMDDRAENARITSAVSLYHPTDMINHGNRDIQNN